MFVGVSDVVERLKPCSPPTPPHRSHGGVCTAQSQFFDNLVSGPADRRSRSAALGSGSAGFTSCAKRPHRAARELVLRLGTNTILAEDYMDVQRMPRCRCRSPHAGLNRSCSVRHAKRFRWTSPSRSKSSNRIDPFKIARPKRGRTPFRPFTRNVNMDPTATRSRRDRWGRPESHYTAKTACSCADSAIPPDGDSLAAAMPRVSDFDQVHDGPQCFSRHYVDPTDGITRPSPASG